MGSLATVFWADPPLDHRLGQPLDHRLAQALPAKTMRTSARCRISLTRLRIVNFWRLRARILADVAVPTRRPTVLNSIPRGRRPKPAEIIGSCVTLGVRVGA